MEGSCLKLLIFADIGFFSYRFDYTNRDVRILYDYWLQSVSTNLDYNQVFELCCACEL
jgi:hypothetical protein